MSIFLWLFPTFIKKLRKLLFTRIRCGKKWSLTRSLMILTQNQRSTLVYKMRVINIYIMCARLVSLVTALLISVAQITVSTQNIQHGAFRVRSPGDSVSFCGL